MYHIRINSVLVTSGEIHLKSTSEGPLPVLSGLFGHFVVENYPRKVPFAANFCSYSPPALKNVIEVDWDNMTEKTEETAEWKNAIKMRLEELERAAQEKLQ